MTTKEIRNEVRELILSKGLTNITNGDVWELRKKLGLNSCERISAALRYFTYSPQTAKYRA